MGVGERAGVLVCDSVPVSDRTPTVTGVPVTVELRLNPPLALVRGMDGDAVGAREPPMGFKLAEELVLSPEVDFDLLVLTVELKLGLALELVELRLRLRLGLGPLTPLLSVDGRVDSGDGDPEADSKGTLDSVDDSVGDVEGDVAGESDGDSDDDSVGDKELEPSVETAGNADIEGELVAVPTPDANSVPTTSGLVDSVTEVDANVEGVADELSLLPTEAEEPASTPSKVLSLGEGEGLASMVPMLVSLGEADDVGS